MGSYAELYIDGREISSWKNYLDDTVMLLFTAADRDDQSGREVVEEEFLHIAERDRPVAFRASAGHILDRLALLGVTERRVAAAVRLLEEHMSAAEWSAKFKSARSAEDISGLLSMLDEVELLPGLRLILTAVDATADVVLDIGDLVAGGWTGDLWSNLDVANYDVDPRDTAQRLRTVDAAEGLPVVVLTEGSTDTEFIGKSLAIIYPHLVGYLRFPDFTTNRPEANAARLGQLVRAFAASGIANRVVAVFDNDTAAADVVRGIDQESLPPNIRIVHYPNIDLAAAYPTRDGDKRSTEDVNGRAGSIELYLGAEVLAQEGRPPVRWGGENSAVGARQGAIERKRAIQEGFRRKVHDASKDHALTADQDWSGMRAILDVIRGAFD